MEEKIIKDINNLLTQLFQKMHEAGYEWDAEKKELKKIEQSPIDVRTTGYWHVENVEQKPFWSEEDEEIYKKIETAIDSYYAPFSRNAEEMSEWFKSFKERYTWKPSIAQLNALSIVSKGNAPDDIEAIVSLYNDLKKLREE